MPHNIVILAVPGVQLLDVAGPLDAFAEANAVLQRRRYRPLVMALEHRAIQASSGITLNASLVLGEPPGEGALTCLVAGAPDIRSLALSAGQRDALIRLCQGSQRFGSVCTGALLLAETGLLDQRRVTTHWAACAELAARFPAISVDADALYVADGPVRTAAGVTSGMDLALRLIEEDVGQEVARDVAARLVMFFRRPAGQGHFMRQQGVSVAGRSALQDLQRWVLSNLHQVSGIQDMASHIQRSPRHLNRLFRQQMGMSCGEWLEGARIAKARELLTGPLPAKSVAAACGYRSSDVLRRAFSKVTGMTPSVYRKMYRAAPS